MRDLTRNITQYLSDREVAALECVNKDARVSVARGVWGGRAYDDARGCADGNVRRCKRVCMERVSLGECFKPLPYSSRSMYTTPLDEWDLARANVYAQGIMCARLAFIRWQRFHEDRKTATLSRRMGLPIAAHPSTPPLSVDQLQAHPMHILRRGRHRVSPPRMPPVAPPAFAP